MQNRQRTIPFAAFVPGNTLVHRAAPALKIGLLIIFILVMSIVATTIPRALAGLVLVVILYVIAHIPPKVALPQLVAPLFILVPLGLFQWWAKGAEFAAVLVISLLSTILAAFLLTLTSTVECIMDSLEHALRPLGKLGLPVETISLAMSLTIRLIPLMFETVYDVLDARKARGLGFSLSAFGTPVIIRSLRRAEALAEALRARGVGD